MPEDTLHRRSRHALHRRAERRCVPEGGARARPALPARPLRRAALARSPAAPAGELKKIKFATNAIAPSAWRRSISRRRRGIFKKYGLDVELIDFGGLDREPARSPRHRQGRRRRRHGAALAEGARSRVRRQDHRRLAWRLLAPRRARSRRASQTLKPTSRARRSAFPTSTAPARISSRSCSTRRGSIRSRTSNGASIRSPRCQLAAEKGEIARDRRRRSRTPTSGCSEPTGSQIASNLDHGFDNRVCCIVGLRGSLIATTADRLAR